MHRHAIHIDAQTSCSQRRIACGFTLIEVLVAILVLSFGMLGVVGLQAAALQANREARFQSSGVRLGRELAEMVRANKDIARQPVNNPYLGNFVALPAAPAVDCRTARCDTAALARYEMREWFERASVELPGLRLVVCFDDAPYTAAGLPQWSCSAAAPLPPGQPAFIKMGWVQQTFNRAADGSTSSPLVDLAVRPSIVMPVILTQ